MIDRPPPPHSWPPGRDVDDQWPDDEDDDDLEELDDEDDDELEDDDDDPMRSTERRVTGRRGQRVAIRNL